MTFEKPDEKQRREMQITILEHFIERCRERYVITKKGALHKRAAPQAFEYLLGIAALEQVIFGENYLLPRTFLFAMQFECPLQEAEAGLARLKAVAAQGSAA